MFYGALALAVVTYAGAGRLIASRVPGNTIGWLLALTGLSLAAALADGAVCAVRAGYGPGIAASSPAGGMVSGTLAALTIALMFFIVLLFPGGRLPSRRWRPVLWAMFAVMATWAAGSLQAGTTIDGAFTSALAAAKVSYPNPLGILPQHGWFNGVQAVIFFLEVITGVLVAASVFARRRSAKRRAAQTAGLAGLRRAVDCHLGHRSAQLLPGDPF